MTKKTKVFCKKCSYHRVDTWKNEFQTFWPFGKKIVDTYTSHWCHAPVITPLSESEVVVVRCIYRNADNNCKYFKD